MATEREDGLASKFAASVCLHQKLRWQRRKRFCHTVVVLKPSFQRRVVGEIIAPRCLWLHQRETATALNALKSSYPSPPTNDQLIQLHLV